MSEHDETTPLREDPALDPGRTWWEDGRHPVNVVHLVMGLVFAGLLMTWALLWTGVADSGDVRWLLPVPWLVAGAVGLVAAGRGARRRA